MKNIFFLEGNNSTIFTVYSVIENFMTKGNIILNTKRHSDCFVYITHGSAEYIFNNYSFTVNSGDVFYLSKNSLYSINILTDSYRFIFVDFDFCRDKESSEYYSDIFHAEDLFNIEKLFHKLLKEWTLRKASYIQICHSVLYEIYAFLIRTKNQTYIPSNVISKLDPAIQYIYDNFINQSINISYLAKLSCMSEVHFRRLFKKIYSTSPSKYITNLKINRSKELLKYKTYTIAHIAVSVGFQNIYYFSKVFKQETGVTPSEYRTKFFNNLDNHI